MKLWEKLSKGALNLNEDFNFSISDFSDCDDDHYSWNTSGSEYHSKRILELEDTYEKKIKAPPCSPENQKDQIQKYKTARLKTKTSSVLWSRKQTHRKVLNLPSTDPGSDLQFTSDDEFAYDTDGYGTIHYKNKNRRTKYKKKLNKEPQKKNKELLYTNCLSSPPKSLDFASNLKNDKHKFNSNFIPEFPPILRNTKRRISWHNSHSRKSLIKSIQAEEELKRKISFKTSFWAGVPNKINATNKTLLKTCNIPIFSKHKSKTNDPQKALLNACSQKLSDWKDTQEESGEKAKTVTIDLVMPDIFIKKRKKNNSQQTFAVKSTLESIKNIKKRNPLFQIMETTHIFEHIAKSKVKDKHFQTVNIQNLPSTESKVKTVSQVIPITKRKIFKTTGLVTTALKTKKKQKEHIIPNFKVEKNTNDISSGKICSKVIKQGMKKKKKKMVPSESYQ